MLQAYWREGMNDEAVFSLFFRKLPSARNYMLACGLDDVLRYLEDLRFGEQALAHLATLGLFSDAFLDWLHDYRFTGDVHAVAEGTPVFPDEPLLEVVAPIVEAQLVESFVMNQIHLQTVLATKASRVVAAAAGRSVVDFGMRRMHGADAAIKGARAFYVAGVDATSNVLAGHVHGIPVAGTMAHSYVQAHENEGDAYRAFTALYPETILLVDTYDTIEGVRKVVKLARELGDAFRVRGIRLDSGDLGALARRSREILNEAGLAHLEIFASGNLDEHRIAKLVASGTPIDAFGVGTLMGVSRDAPSLDLAYKLTGYAGSGRLKTSPGKTILPGRKQVFRIEEDDRAVRDVITRHTDEQPGRALLEPVMKDGQRLPGAETSLSGTREHAAAELSKLPARVRALERAEPPYPVEISEVLRRYQATVREQVVR
jgi:nicotinate phosphoribosyltransferase